jgi:hypothetical protein
MTESVKTALACDIQVKLDDLVKNDGIINDGCLGAAVIDLLWQRFEPAEYVQIIDRLFDMPGAPKKASRPGKMLTALKDFFDIIDNPNFKRYLDFLNITEHMDELPDKEIVRMKRAYLNGK